MSTNTQGSTPQASTGQPSGQAIRARGKSKGSSGGWMVAGFIVIVVIIVIVAVVVNMSSPKSAAAEAAASGTRASLTTGDNSGSDAGTDSEPKKLSLTAKRKYPPMPYTGPPGGENDQRLTVSWAVSGADYGNGTYTASVDKNFTEWGRGSFDVEGLVDGYLDEVAGNLGSYHTERGAPEQKHIFKLKLPVAISLDEIAVTNRPIADANHYAKSPLYVISGIKSDGTKEKLTESVSKGKDDYKVWKITIPEAKKKTLYDEFEVIITGVAGKWVVVGELTLYGREKK